MQANQSFDGTKKAEKQFEKRRLTAAIRAEEGHDSALLNREAKSADERSAVISERQVVDLEEAHQLHPLRALRSTTAKQGMPTNAVTMPIGIS